MFRICVDTGGTFTDCLVLDEEGNLAQFKAPTTPADLAAGLIDALGNASGFYGRTLQQFISEIELIASGINMETIL